MRLSFRGDGSKYMTESRDNRRNNCPRRFSATNENYIILYRDVVDKTAVFGRAGMSELLYI